ncbi:hypothetical protein V6N11_053887 [Hibiscus sabdariffa]|uniref:non-specific serine/threonine protein kinase n=1 Tax=Hibiscus sabdariffa TaxID=183260 RepID=A0ABR2S2E4_9ROSI
MASPVWFITLFISYVSLGAGVGFVSTLASGLVTSATASPLEDEAEALLHTGWWSWYSNDTSKHCKWPGISCNEAGSVIRIYRHSIMWGMLGKLEKLNLSCFPNLVYLDLCLSGSSGSIPPQIDDLSSLEYLDLSYNSLTGELPQSLGKLICLKDLNLSYNSFQGSIPIDWGSLKSLMSLQMMSCNISGPVPYTLGNLTNLKLLDLSNNQITGHIPSTLGYLINLKQLDLSFNQINGAIPPTLGGLINLEILSFTSNQISSSIPSELGNMTSLVELHLDENKLKGRITPSISNLSKLEDLKLHSNLLRGSIPREIWNMKNLVALSFSNNKFSGFIPSTLSSLSRLSSLYLDSNLLQGPIPSEIGNLRNLSELNLSRNKLCGLIPSSLSNLSSLSYLFLDSNLLQGPIPHEIGNLKSLSVLKLSRNKLTGLIPLSLSNLSRLSQLYLDSNLLEGPLPQEMGNLNALINLDLSCNKLIGTIPSRIGNCSTLQELSLSNNHLNGSIPFEIFCCARTLNLSHNFFQGQIQLQYAGNHDFYVLDLSHNNLTGMIPESLRYFVKVNLSYNSLEGPIPHYLSIFSTPDSFWGNQLLCGNVQGFPQCSHSPIENTTTSSKMIHKVEIVLSVVGVLVFFCSGFLLWLRCRAKYIAPEPNVTKNGDLFSIWNFDGRIAFEDIIKATNDFDIRYCVGTGGYGSVYRAQLPSGKIVALKKLHRREAEVPAFDRSFKNEAKMLSEIRHKNIVKLHGFCLHNRCMFLIYEYMSRGSLFSVFIDDTEATELDWIKRVKVIKDTTELAYTMIVTEKCDVYSFGVLALETLMGKHPAELLASLSTLPSNNIMLSDILDHRLSLPSDRRVAKDIVFAATIAFACLRADPKFRPTMKHVSQEFLSPKRAVADCLQVISVLQLKNHDLYREGEGKIQSENAVLDGEVHVTSST